MSYTAAINEVKAAAEAVSGITYTTEPRLSSLLFEGKAGLHGKFSLEDTTGPQAWPQISNNPSHWFCRLRLEIGFEISTDKLEQGKTLEGWARGAIEALRYASLTNGQVFDWQPPEVLRNENDKRAVWVAQFALRYWE